MKIEKMNDRQIRCTLTHEDLVSREIKLSELAYGSEKANQLFHDMMEQANEDFGFDVDNMPIMVEAVPLPNDQIMLLITKVDSPDELDTRFSNFTSYEGENGEHSSEDEPEPDSATEDAAAELIDLFDRLGKGLSESKQSDEETAENKQAKSVQHAARPVRIYTAETLDQLINAAGALDGLLPEKNTLYKNPDSGIYYLVIYQGKTDASDFKRMNHRLISYLKSQKYSPAILSNMHEHYQPIAKKEALQMLARLK